MSEHMNPPTIDQQEQAFWQWWDKIEPYKSQYSLRMAFDAGYQAAKESEIG